MKVQQRDLICLECPLHKCDEASLWCLLRFVTDPNEAQQRLMNRKARDRRTKVKRADYFRKYYISNRGKKLAAASERYARQNRNPAERVIAQDGKD